MDGRILVKDRSDQMVEALDQSSTSEGIRDDLGRRLSSQFLRGHAVGIGHIDDGLSLPGRQCFATSRCDSKRTAKKTLSALTASASFPGSLHVTSVSSFSGDYDFTDKGGGPTRVTNSIGGTMYNQSYACPWTNNVTYLQYAGSRFTSPLLAASRPRPELRPLTISRRRGSASTLRP